MVSLADSHPSKASSRSKIQTFTPKNAPSRSNFQTLKPEKSLLKV
jgi:hypothetical protein